MGKIHTMMLENNIKLLVNGCGQHEYRSRFDYPVALEMPHTKPHYDQIWYAHTKVNPPVHLLYFLPETETVRIRTGTKRPLLEEKMNKVPETAMTADRTRWR